MKSLLDIQLDIRKLEKSVAVISDDIRIINSDLDDIRNSENEVAIDYDMIEVLSKNFKFGKHPIEKLEDGGQCQIYLEMLLSIVRLDCDKEITISRMVFLQWLQIQSRIDWSLEELYKDAYKMNKQAYVDLIEEIPNKYRECFLVDALITAHIGGAANKEIQTYIADIASIMGVPSDKFRALAILARVTLCQEFEGIKRDDIETVLSYAKSYGYYLSAKVISKGKILFREVVVKVSDKDVYDLKWKVKQSQKVSKGDLLAICQKYRSGRMREESLYAPVGGTIFQFRDNNTYYGVISYETDNKDSIKSWVRETK